VAVVGSVQQEAIYEVKPGETIEQVLALAGGLNVLADPDRVVVYGLKDQSTPGPREISRRDAGSTVALGGDIVQVISRGTLVQPISRQSVLVRIEGEVSRPGNYYVSPSTPLSALMDLAGGTMPSAYLYGTRLERQSVKEQQKVNFKDAINQLEFSLASAPLIADSSVSDSRRTAEMAGARELIDLMRKQEPDGRVVLDIAPSAVSLPGNLLLENNDRIVIPPKPTTVGVFGAVYRPASFYMEGPAMRVKEFIARAGGPQQVGDKSRVFVVRANGDVITRGKGALDAVALPGDVIFIPVKSRTTDFWAKVRDITTVFFQLGVTAAAFNSIK
jgi:protein involved in polysaccharide export with SLBB domain